MRSVRPFYFLEAHFMSGTGSVRFCRSNETIGLRLNLLSQGSAEPFVLREMLEQYPLFRKGHSLSGMDNR